MKFLIDTNIFLEIILQQNKAQKAREFLAHSQSFDFYMTDFTLHSIGILLFKRGAHETFLQFVHDMIFKAGIQVLGLKSEDMSNVIEASQRYRLDFDDAYQYAVAEKYNLTIVSFDHDFDQTERGRVDPDEISTPQDNEREP